MSSYAKDDSGTKKSDSGTKKDDSGSKKADDSNKRSDSGSGDKSKEKITICHVPPGNPANKHTIHIAFSAWKAHQAHTNDIGPDFADYLGSCNSKSTTPTKEPLHIISGCTGDARATLASKVQSYFEPITVADTALDDETIVTALSQCLDKGDSSDSGKSDSNKGKSDSNKNSKSSSGGKGGGHDSVSDSGNHHRIRGCENKDTTHKADSTDSGKHGSSDSNKSDSNKNYHTKLKNADSGYDADKGIKDPVVVSDSSLDDSGVWKEYKKCAADSNNASKIDSGKTGKSKGDSGHKQHILKSCGDDQDKKVKDAITAYRAKDSTKDIILTETSYNDVWIKQAVDACVTGGATDTTTTPTTSTGTSGRLNFRENTSPIKDATTK